MAIARIAITHSIRRRYWSRRAKVNRQAGGRRIVAGRLAVASGGAAVAKRSKPAGNVKHG
jgi:hypothetical protein